MPANGVRVLEALADPTRRAIFETLALGEATVGELATAVGISSSAASQHVGTLRKARLVRTRRVGNRNRCALDPRGLSDARDYLETFWPRALAAHQAALAQELVPDDQPTRR